DWSREIIPNKMSDGRKNQEMEKGIHVIRHRPRCAWGRQLTKSGVAVEKLLSVKFAKIKLRQDALQTIFSIFLDIFYPPNFRCFEENGLFQHPHLLTKVRGLMLNHNDEIKRGLRADHGIGWYSVFIQDRL